MPDELNLRFLGGMHIALGDAPVVGFISAKAQALLCYLAVTGRPHTREALATLLWGDMPEERAAHSLRQALSNLQKLVGAHLTVTRQTLAFDRTSPYTLDTDTFAALLKAAEVSAIGARRRRETAVALYQGDFLAGFAVRDAPDFDDWVTGMREWLRQQVLGALSHLAAYFQQHGEYAEAEHSLRRMLELDPWREDAHRLLMLALAYQGQHGAALAQYQRCRCALAEGLGEEPAAETTDVYRRIRAGEVEPPALRLPPTNLPIVPTPLVGRETELGDVIGLLEDPARRLVTLVGPGGIGKTRLALAVASECRPTSRMAPTSSPSRRCAILTWPSAPSRARSTSRKRPRSHCWIVSRPRCERKSC